MLAINVTINNPQLGRGPSITPCLWKSLTGMSSSGTYGEIQAPFKVVGSLPYVAAACVWASPPLVVQLCHYDQEPCVFGVGLFGQYIDVAFFAFLIKRLPPL